MLCSLGYRLRSSVPSGVGIVISNHVYCKTFNGIYIPLRFPLENFQLGMSRMKRKALYFPISCLYLCATKVRDNRYD